MKMPKELYQALKEEAENKNISLSSLIRLICSEYLESKKK
jgi:predicted DNA-binding ribbon-helix-helix protein